MTLVSQLDNDDANDLADEIMSREEFFASRDPGFVEQAVERVVEVIGDVLEWIFGPLFRAGGAAAGVGQFLAYGLLAVAVGILGLAIYRAIRGYERSTDDDDSGARIIFDEAVDPDDLTAALGSATAVGDWRGAVIAGFRLAVLELIDRRVAFARAGATTRDFADDVEERSSALVDVYERAAVGFERAFYSDQEITEDDHRAVGSLREAITRATVAEPVSAPAGASQ